MNTIKLNESADNFPEILGISVEETKALEEKLKDKAFELAENEQPDIDTVKWMVANLTPEQHILLSLQVLGKAVFKAQKTLGDKCNCPGCQSRRASEKLSGTAINTKNGVPKEVKALLSAIAGKKLKTKKDVDKFLKKMSKKGGMSFPGGQFNVMRASDIPFSAREKVMKEKASDLSNIIMDVQGGSSFMDAILKQNGITTEDGPETSISDVIDAEINQEPTQESENAEDSKSE